MKTKRRAVKNARDHQKDKGACVSGAFVVLVSGLCILCVGCEQLSENLPWFSKKQKDPAAATLSTPTGKAAVPDRPRVLPQEVIANVNGTPISKTDVELFIQERKLLSENLGQEWTRLSADEMEGVLEQLIHSELMRQDAVAQGLTQAADTQRRWEFVHRGFFAQEWLRKAQERVTVSPEEIQKYYEQNKAGFREPERVRLKELVVASEDQAKQALARLHGESFDFATLAQQISLGPTAAKGGMIENWIMRSDDKAFLYPQEADASAAGVISLDPVLEAAAFAIDQLGGLSNYVKGSDGQYHIFRLSEKQQARQRPINEIWDEIKSFLQVQKFQESITDLNNKAKIERFTDRLEGVTQ